MKMEMPTRLQKKVTRYGSVLKACRVKDRGSGLLLILGVYFIACGVLLGGILAWEDIVVGGIFAACFAAVGFIVLMIYRIKIKNYLSYYQKQSGYSVEELMQADKELMGYSAVKIGGVTELIRDIPLKIGREQKLMFIITEHYFFAVGSLKGSYLRRLSDIVAAFYSCQIPQYGGYREGLFLISRQDIGKKPRKNRVTKKWYGGYESGSMVLAQESEKLCEETLNEIRKRVPYIIPQQNIMINGIIYNLLSLENWQADWARIMGGH